GKVWPINNLKTTPTLGTAVTGITTPWGIAMKPRSLTSTVTDAISNGRIYKTYISSITANWTALGTGLGYRLEASTASDFLAVAGASVTASLSLSTLTVQNLASNTTYYLRVSGLDPTGTYNWSVFGSTVT